jgi:AraC-like DNA-binding protein
LNYCSRFYGRQLITRSQTNQTIITQIETILNSYFQETKVKEQGLPSVKFLADKLNVSPSYLSDVLKKETGKNAQEHIHFFLIKEAKNYLLNTEKNINEIAYTLGFEYPQYFNKLFKQKTGNTPMEYRNLN